MAHRRLKIASNLQTRAAFEPSTFDEKAGTVEVVFTTGARARRSSYYDGPYYEELEVSAAACDLSRLNNGAPVLDTHDLYSGVRGVLGVVEKAWLVGKEGRALIRFSDREDVQPVKRDVQNGILRHVSVGYTIEQLELVEKVEDVPVYRATKWTPFEISQCPVAVDDAATVRSRRDPEFLEVEVLSRSEETIMPVETTPAKPATTTVPVAAAPAAPSDEAVRAVRDEATRAETGRVTAIRALVAKHKLGDEFAATLIGTAEKSGPSLEQARALVLEELARRSDALPPSPNAQHERVEAGEDARDKFVRGACAAIYRVTMQEQRIRAAQKGPFARQFEDVSTEPAEFRGVRKLSDLARASLEFRGVSTKGLFGERLFEQAFRGYNGSGDFPILLDTAMTKIMLASYAAQPATWRRWCGVKSVVDFRTAYFYRNGSFGTLDTVNEHGEFKTKAIPDGEKTGVAVDTKGNIIGLTRKAMVNDDLGVFNDLGGRFGETAGRSVESDSYGLLALNAGLGPTQTDGQPLFHAANRANIGSGGAITSATVSSMRQKMRAQKDPSGNDFLDLNPAVLLVPPGIEDAAKILNGDAFDPAQAGQKTNPVRGLFRDIVSSPRLTASTTRHYAFADPGSYPAIVVSFLDGQEAPELRMEESFGVDGVRWRVRFDYGVQVFDHRAAVTCAGV